MSHGITDIGAWDLLLVEVGRKGMAGIRARQMCGPSKALTNLFKTVTNISILLMHPFLHLGRVIVFNGIKNIRKDPFTQLWFGSILVQEHWH